MRAQQRKTVLVILHLLCLTLPAVDCVTLVATRSHQPAMDVRMAVDTILAHVRKDRLRVAFHARHFFVQAAQRVLGLVVVKFGDRANRAPACGGVAVLARNCQRAVRIARGFFLRSGQRGTCGWCAVRGTRSRGRE